MRISPRQFSPSPVKQRPSTRGACPLLFSPVRLEKGVCILPNGEKVIRRRRYFPTLRNMLAITWGHLKYYLPFYRFEARFRENLFAFNTKRLGIKPEDIESLNIFELYPDRMGRHRDGVAGEKPVRQVVIVGDGPGEPDMSGNLMISPVKRVFETGQVQGFRSFLVGGGDNVYPVMSLENARTSLAEPLSSIPMDNDFVFFCGNHEAWGDIYGVFKKPELHQMMGRPPHLYYSLVFDSLKTRVICLDSGAKGTTLDERQVLWLKRQLQEANKNGHEPIVLLHHPPIINGIETKSKLWKVLEPLLVEHGVKKLIGFHEHNYQHYKKTYARADGERHTIDIIVQGNFGAFTHSTHRIGEKSIFEKLLGWIPLVGRIWSKKKYKPILLCPSREESRAFFTWFKIGSWKVMVPSILEWWWALRDKPPFFKGFSLLENPNGKPTNRLHHYVRSHYREATCVIDEV